MRCTNCGANVPRGLTSCPACGVYALDGPPPPRKEEKKRQRSGLSGLLLLVLVVAAGAGGWWWFTQEKKKPVPQYDRGPVRVVRDRPGGGNINEAEAIRALRQHLATREPPVASNCVAVISHGLHGGAYDLTALDSCTHTSLGNFKVDRRSQKVTSSSPKPH